MSSVSVADLSIKMSANSTRMNAGLRTGRTEVKMLAAEVKSASARASEAFGRAVSGITPMKLELMRTQEATAKNEARMKSLKDSMEFLNGAGKIAGITMLGAALHSLARNVRQVSDDIRAGEKSFAEIGDAALAATPFVGNFWAAGREFRAAIDGTTAYEAAMKKVEEQTQRNNDAMQELWASHDRLNGETAAVKRGTGAAQMRGMATNDFDRAGVDATVKLNEARLAAEAEYGKTMADLDKQFQGATGGKALEAFRHAAEAAGKLRDAQKQAAGVEFEQAQTAAAEADQRAFSSLIDSLQQEQAVLQQVISGTTPALAQFNVELEKMVTATDEQKKIATETIAAELKRTDVMREQAKAQEEQRQRTEQNAKDVQQSIADAEAQLASIGQTEIEIKIGGLVELGASIEQVERYRELLKQIEAESKRAEESRKAEDDAKRVLETIAEAKQELENIGKTPIEIKLQGLEMIGATAEQLAEYKAILEAADAKQKVEAWTAATADAANSLRSDSEEAQIKRDRFLQGGGNQMGPKEAAKDDVAKKVEESTEQLVKINSTLERQAAANRVTQVRFY